jgi:hypothetical protein
VPPFGLRQGDFLMMTTQVLPTNQQTEHETAMSKAEIIAELENMVATRLFSGQPWLADWETNDAVHRKLVQMGLVEVVCVESQTSRSTALGKELDVELFEVFMGHLCEWEVPSILEHYHLLDESEADAILERMTEANAETVLLGYVKRAYFDYRKATKFLH